MQVYTEHFATEEALFKRVDEILVKGGLYNIAHHPAGFTINFWFFEGCNKTYTVANGRNGEQFKFKVGADFVGEDMFLQKGDVLIFEYAVKNKREVWFYCPKVLIGQYSKEIFPCLGFTEYGQLPDMLKEGLIEGRV